MKVVMVTTNDPAGTAIGMKKALERHTPHRCRLVTTELRYNFGFEKDLHLPWLADFGEVERVLKEAELFHLHMTADAELPLGPFRLGDFFRGQPVIHHHHGEPPFRADPRAFADVELAAGEPALVSTPDLLRGYPEARWVPNPVALDEPDYQPRPRPERDRIVVGHSPTRIELKNTAEFKAVMKRLARVLPVEARILRNTPHRQCLRRKAEGDLFFDHMQGYFGVSSLEALSQGVPTLAGIDDWNRHHIEAFTGTSELPWVVVHDPEALEASIAELVADPDRRAAIGQASRAFMEAHWSEAHVAAALDQFYSEVG